MSPTTTTSSRWCPTPEQLMILEEIYKNGLKTPNAAQIQQITSHLSLYGKIEGKNVFYWFQNHKARDRQKLRRKLYKQLQLQFQQQQQQQQQMMFRYQCHSDHEQQELLMKHQQCGFIEQQPYYYLHHFQPQYSSSSSLGLHQQLLLPGCFHGREVEETSTMKKLMEYEIEKCGMIMYDHDRTAAEMATTENEGRETTACGARGSLKTLELFPIRGSYVKEDSTRAKEVSCSSSLCL